MTTVLSTEALERRIALFFESYKETVDVLASFVRRTEVIPFCDKHGVQFRAGMGTWTLYDPKTQKSIWISTYRKNPEFVRLQKLLDTPVDGMDQYLGSLMKDYTPGGAK